MGIYERKLAIGCGLIAWPLIWLAFSIGGFEGVGALIGGISIIVGLILIGD